VFDGNDLSISNFSIDVNNVNNDCLGLFGSIKTGGEVRNLRMLDVNIVGGHNTGFIGCIAGENMGNISDCNVNVIIICKEECSFIGGLIGSNKTGVITKCHSTSKIQCFDSICTGGLAGINLDGGSITYCTSIVDCNILHEMSASTLSYSGGLIGLNYEASISECSAEGVVSGVDYVGGLLGVDLGITPLVNSSADVNVFGLDYVGGLVGGGGINSEIRNCSASGKVSGTYCVGGLVGEYNNSINSSYATGDVSGSSDYVGGLGGLLWMLEDDEISNCYAIGNVTGDDLTGGLIGSNNCTIKDSYASGNVEGDTEGIGGLVGSSSEDSIIVNCKAFGNVTAPASNLGTGGLAGINVGVIHSCYANGNVIGTDYIGGLVGINEGFVSFSYAMGDVNGQSYIGGLIGKSGIFGQNTGSIKYSFHVGDVNGTADRIGGLVGTNLFVPIDSSFAIGSVSGAQFVGGLCGVIEESRVDNSYALGTVKGDEKIGGLFGAHVAGGGRGGSPSDKSIFNCYAAAKVSGNAYVGAISGTGDSGGHFTVSFWDTDLNPDVNGFGIPLDPPNVVGKTTAEMQMKSTFTDEGWDFVGEAINGPNDVWTIKEGVRYPEHVWPLVQYVDWDGVDFGDYGFFADYYGRTDCNDINDCNSTDLDFSGGVDNNDLDIFTSYWMFGK
jgi:hypothetical protein